MTEDISWDDAIKTSGFVNLVQDEEKRVTLTNWRFEKVSKFGKDGVEFVSDCVEEDGETVDKKLTVMSTRLKKKLRPIFEKKNPADKVRLSIIKVGDKFDTQYSVKELK